MKILDIMIHTTTGIHARNALLLGNILSQFQSNISIRKEKRVENAKSAVFVMTMHIKCNDNISFVIDGNDEIEAYTILEEFCKRNL